MLFLRHPAWLWLKKHDKTKLPAPDENLQAMFDAGHDFEQYAEQLFPSGVRLGFNSYNEYLSLPARTTTALQNNLETIFQGRFEVDNLTCIVDVLQKNPDNTYNLIEIKTSTKAKPEHEYDLAFQLLVLEKAGLSISEISVLHANKEYVRFGEIDPHALVAKTVVSESVRALRNITLEQVEHAHAVVAQKTRPDTSPRHVNHLRIPNKSSEWLTEWLAIYQGIHGVQDRYSIYNLAYPSPKQLGNLEDAGITTISEMTEDQALREKQAAQIRTTKSNQRLIQKDAIKAFLDTFQYPLYFFDYETFSSAVPQFDGTSPYQDYPFQYSLHCIQHEGASPQHFEYLHTDASNPMPGLLAQMHSDLGDTGTILAWNMGYEKGCNDRMAKLYPEYAGTLSAIDLRMNDLMIPFANMWYFDKDFFGSASIKKVLPVLAPELSYKELGVGDGLLARRLWTETVLEGKHSESRPAIIQDLRAYCKLDTFAMVRILEFLKTL